MPYVGCVDTDEPCTGHTTTAGKEEVPEALDPKANPRRRGMRGFCMVGRDASKALWESQLRWGPKEDRHHEFQKVYVLLLRSCSPFVLVSRA